MAEIEMPVHRTAREIHMNFKESYVAVIWSRDENDAQIEQEMKKINMILAADGFQMVKWEKRSEMEKRYREAFK